MCSITPRRIAVIGSSTSPVCSAAATGAGVGAGFGGVACATAGSGAAGVAAGCWAAATGSGAGTGSGAATGSGTVWAGGPDSMYLRMSFFVTRPPVPVPGTAVGSMPCSEAIRATTGEMNVRPPLSPATPAAGGVGCGVGSWASAGVAG